MTRARENADGARLDAPLASPAFTGTPTGITAAHIGITTGISNTNHLVANANVADDDFLRVDGTSIEGRTAAEVLSDIGAQASGTYLTSATANIQGLYFEADSGTVTNATKEVRAYTSTSGGWIEGALMLGIGGQSGGLSGIGGGTCAASGYFASSSWYSTTAIQPTWTAGSYITLTGPTEAGGYVYYTIGSNTAGKTTAFKCWVLGTPGCYLSIV